MTASRIVLGWARDRPARTAQMTTRKVGSLFLLMTTAQTAAVPRAIMHQQVRCFENGIDFLPTAPAGNMTETQGVRLAETHERTMTAELARLKGKGQLNLSMNWESPTDRKLAVSRGQDWLRARQHGHAVSDHRRRRAMAFLDQCKFNGWDTCTRQPRNRVERDVLMPRGELEDALSHIRRQAADCDENDLALAITGLWPPFSFVKPF